MSLTALQLREIVRRGKIAALRGDGAYTCPYMEDNIRFEAWIKGYANGEEQLRLTHNQARQGGRSEIVSSHKP